MIGFLGAVRDIPQGKIGPSDFDTGKSYYVGCFWRMSLAANKSHGLPVKGNSLINDWRCDGIEWLIGAHHC